MPDIPEINKSLVDLEKELQNINSASKMIKSAEDAAEKTISESKKILGDLIKESKTTTDKTITESKKLNESTTLLHDAVNDLINRLGKVDFPIRLDKIDATVSGINSSIQNVIHRLDSVEGNIKSDINDKLTIFESNIMSTLKNIKKRQLINRILLSVITVISICGVVYFLIR